MTRTVPFVFTQFNIGDHGTYADLLSVVDPTATDVASLNEMYNRQCQKMIDRLLREHGDLLGVVEFPDVEGARADILVYSKATLDLRDPQCYKVLPAGTRDGKHNMQKNLVGGVFNFTPVPCRMNLFAKHAIQTQGPEERRQAAIRQSRNEVVVLDPRTAITMVFGDWNAVNGAPSLAPYGGWRFTQRDDPTPTLKNRGVDGGMWHGPDHVPGAQVTFVKNTVLHGTKSDHLPIRAHFEIKTKPW